MILASLPWEHYQWLANLNDGLAQPWVGAVQVLAAIVCGTLIGIERNLRHKPAGLRTVTLICLGSTIFTMSSLLLTQGNGDPSRVAAQVVTGIGFLGAGSIIRHGESVIGLTTAATIWVVAAIGVLIGAGYAIPAVVLSGVVFLLLRLHEPPNGGETVVEGNSNSDTEGRKKKE